MKKNSYLLGNVVKEVLKVPFTMNMAVWQLERALNAPVKKTNLAIGLIMYNERREVVVIYLDSERYWFVFLNEQVDKVSAVSAGDYIISMYFVTNIRNGFEIEAEPGEKYKVYPKKKDIEIVKMNV